MTDDEAGEGRQPEWTRRAVLSGLAALPIAASAASASSVAASQAPDPVESEERVRGSAARAHVVVVGAGAFGGWTALALRRRGFRVTLVDAWGPGNARASSGGDTRVIRGMYGPDQIYTDWVVEAFAAWDEASSRWGADLYHPTGALWMFRGDDAYARSSLPYLREAGLEVETLSVDDAARRWPHISFEGIRAVHYEPRAGYLTARDACRAVADALVREGGEMAYAEARPPADDAAGRGGAGLATVDLGGGSRLAADHFVFACGPWLGALFPEAVGRGIRPTRQEVFYFGTPPAPTLWLEPAHGGAMPTWIDFGERVVYGVPGNLHRGFKVADDTHGPEVDPSSQERAPSPDALAAARDFLAERFPGLAGAPLLESRVCQYENTPDGHYLIDRHPRWENVWIVGGGSGHGFKLGPSVGRHVSELIAGTAEPLARFSLARLAELGDGEERSQLRSG